MQELRTTTGQLVTVTYDPKNNALIFTETDWFADPIRSSAVPVKSRIVRPLGARNIVPLPARRATHRRAAA